MDLTPKGWKRSISPEEAADIQEYLRKAREGEKEQKELKDLEKEKRKEELLSEIKKSRRERAMAEQEEQKETAKRIFKNAGMDDEQAEIGARELVGGNAASRGGIDANTLMLMLMLQQNQNQNNNSGDVFDKMTKAGQALTALGLNDVVSNWVKEKLSSSGGSNNGEAPPDPESIANGPQDRRITWRRDPSGGWIYENVDASQASQNGGGENGGSPASQFKQWLDQTRESIGAIGELAETLGYRKPESGADGGNGGNDQRPWMNMPLRIGNQTANVAVPLDNPGSILDYHVKSMEIDQKEREAKERNQGLLLLLSWLAGMGGPQEVARQARQAAQGVQDRFQQGGQAQGGQNEREPLRCDECGAVFADAGQRPVVCPNCGTELDVEGEEGHGQANEGTNEGASEPGSDQGGGASGQAQGAEPSPEL